MDNGYLTKYDGCVWFGLPFSTKDFYFSKICYFLYSWTASLGVKESSICSTNVQLIVYTQYYKDKRDNICNIIKSGHQAIDS